MKTSTKAIHYSYQKPDAYGALSMPIYHTCAYEFPDADIMADAFCGRVELPDYTRVTNPTVIYFEKKAKALTGATSSFAFCSGMAAITGTLMSLAAAGKTIISSNHLFGNTWLLISKTLGRFGVKSKFIDLTDLEAVKAAIDSDSCCIYAEIISYPHQEVVDLKALSEIAHSFDCRHHDDSIHQIFGKGTRSGHRSGFHHKISVRRSHDCGRTGPCIRGQ